MLAPSSNVGRLTAKEKKRRRWGIDLFPSEISKGLFRAKRRDPLNRMGVQGAVLNQGFPKVGLAFNAFNVTPAGNVCLLWHLPRRKSSFWVQQYQAWKSTYEITMGACLVTEFCPGVKER